MIYCHKSFTKFIDLLFDEIFLFIDFIIFSDTAGVFGGICQGGPDLIVTMYGSPTSVEASDSCNNVLVRPKIKL